MINIIVDGVRLDLLPANLSYKRTNNAYSFGKLTLNRTQSFKLPKTQKNMQLFGCGLPYAFGEGERRYFDAQLQGSGFVENGLIYIDSIDAEEITCIFIFGNLIKLKEISNIKNMAEVLGEYDSAISAPAYTGTKLANATDLQLYDAVQYRNQYSQSYGYYDYIMPSVSVRGLLNCANEIYGEIFDLSPIPDYRIIQSTTKSASREPVVFAKTSLNVASPAEDLKKLFTYNAGAANIYSDTGNVGSYQAKAMIEYLTLRDSEIKMPSDFPSDVFILWDKSRYDKNSGKVNVDVEFFGGYSFETDLRTVNSLAEEGTRATIGEPLAGRTITIPKGKNFSFYRKDDFHNTAGAGGSSYNNYRGFFNGDTSPFEYVMPVVSLKEEGLTTCNPFLTFMIDNLPKMSFIDLYNSVAILAGGYMTYANNKVTIGYYGFDVYPLKNVISHGKIKREGLTSAQNNYIQFEESEAVKPANRIIQNYPTVNALLEEEAIVYRFPYSEGEEYTDNNDLQSSNVVVSKVAEGVTGCKPIELQSDTPIIALAGDGQYLKRVTLQSNFFLKRIQQNSTQIEVTCYMTLFEFMSIKEQITIEFLHQQWAWISATWQKDKAKFVLQRI